MVPQVLVELLERTTTVHGRRSRRFVQAIVAPAPAPGGGDGAWAARGEVGTRRVGTTPAAAAVPHHDTGGGSPLHASAQSLDGAVTAAVAATGPGGEWTRIEPAGPRLQRRGAVSRRPRGQWPPRGSGPPSVLPSHIHGRPDRCVSMSSPVTFAGTTVVPPSIFRAVPPYERLEPLRDLPTPGPGAFGRGTVWLVSATPRPGGWETVAEWLLRLRSAYPAITIGVLLPEDVDPHPLLSTSAVATARVRAVLRRGEPVTALRGRMTRPTGLGAEIVQWLRLAGILLRPRVATGVRALLDSEQGSMAAALTRSRPSQRTLRRHFARCGLPQPREWHAAARALRAALRLQADPQTSLLRVALDSGYGDHATFSRQMRRLFDLRPLEIRGTLGWEWVLHRWVSRWAPATRAHDVISD